MDYVFWPAAVRNKGFRQHVIAAAAGGFTSLAIAPETYRKARAEGMSDIDLMSFASSHGVPVRHLDTVTDWAPIRVPSDCSDDLRRRFDVSANECFSIVEALNLESMLAVAGYDPDTVAQSELVKGFARLCDRAAAMGVWVDLEFMPFWGLPDLRSAWDIVRAADRPNSGIMLDTWHFAKGNPDFHLLSEIPGERLASMQISDALYAMRGATLFEDTVHFRLFPGEGELPINKMIQVILGKGGLRHVGPEVFSDFADTLDAHAAGVRSGETLRNVLTAAGLRVPHQLLVAGGT